MTPTTIRLIAILSACALLVALLPLPYGYYQLLRWGICLAAAVLGVGRWNHAPYSGSALILIAILFNPLDPITFARGIRAFLDIGAAAVFGWVALHPRPDRTARATDVPLRDRDRDVTTSRRRPRSRTTNLTK